MNTKIVLFIALMTMIGVTPAFASYGLTEKPVDCIANLHNGERCFSYEPRVAHDDSTHQYQKLSPSFNWSMDIIAPDGTCNIKGHLNPVDGSCSYQSVVLNQNDFDTLKTNISVLAVVHIHNSGMTPQAYCPVAIWTWGTQDQIFQHKYNVSMVIPSYCNAVPEFGQEVAIVLSGIVAIGIVVGAHKGLNYKP